MLGLVLYQAVYSKFPQLPMRLPSSSRYRVLKANNNLTLHDKEGKTATWERHTTIRLNQEESDVLISRWHGDGAFVKSTLSASGRVVKLKNEKKGVSRYLYASFQVPVKKNEIVELTLTIDLHDAFLAKTESLTHVVLDDTDQISFEVRFPDNRKCTAADFKRVVGAVETGLAKPKTDGSVVRASIQGGIRTGDLYELDWNW